jgi:hypothetical protein
MVTHAWDDDFDDWTPPQSLERYEGQIIRSGNGNQPSVSFNTSLGVSKPCLSHLAQSIPLSVATIKLIDGIEKTVVKQIPLVSILTAKAQEQWNADPQTQLHAKMISMDALLGKLKQKKFKDFYSEGTTTLHDHLTGVEIDDDDDLMSTIMQHFQVRAYDGVGVEFRAPEKSKAKRGTLQHLHCAYLDHN